MSILLYCGDNPDVLRRHAADESINLSYLDSSFYPDAAPTTLS